MVMCVRKRYTERHDYFYFISFCQEDIDSHLWFILDGTVLVMVMHACKRHAEHHLSFVFMFCFMFLWRNMHSGMFNSGLKYVKKNVYTTVFFYADAGSQSDEASVFMFHISHVVFFVVYFRHGVKDYSFTT